MIDLNKAENQLSGEVVDSCFKIHQHLGPGLLESVYEEVLSHELKNKRGFHIQRQAPIQIEYEGLMMEKGFLADIIVEHTVIIEIKSVKELLPVHSKQLQTYLRLSGLPIGILANFNEAYLKNGLKRIVNGL